MAEPLKNLYSTAYIQKVCVACAREIEQFDAVTFQNQVFDEVWESRELKSRTRHLATVIGRFIPGNYAQKIETLERISRGFSGYPSIFFSDFIEVYGLEEPHISIPALATFTPICSSEFAIRPFLIRYQQLTMEAVLDWAKSDNAHVRRLASEGIRPRLPWGQDVPWIKKNPSEVLPVLELLKNDPSEYVRRSVANNLNDISKSHPSLVIELAQRWKGISTETDKLLKHALRGLLKKGNSDALALFDFVPVQLSIHRFELDRNRLKIGEKLGFNIALRMDSPTQKIRLEYVVHYQKANGSKSPKVFQLTETVLALGEELKTHRHHAFANLSTRIHYPGTHEIHLHINGRSVAQLEFMLEPNN